MRRACRTCIPLVTIMAATAESTPFGQGLGPAQLAKLQAWFSPAFPVGGFSYSHGLEWAVENEGVQDARALAQWVEGALRYGAGRCMDFETDGPSEIAAALARIVAAFMGSVDLLEFAGLCWTAAFILFVLLYGPLLAMRSPGWNEARR